MAKNPNSKSKPTKRSEPMSSAMKLFLAGCVAEIYLLIVRRYYINGTALQQIAWYDTYLKVFIGVGAVVLLAGLGLFYMWRTESKAKREIGLYIAGLGAFLSLSSGLLLWNMSTASPLSLVVPVVMLLGVLWMLYDRECAMSLSILSFSLIAIWIGRRQISTPDMGTWTKVIVIICLVVLAVIAWLLKQGKLTRLLPDNADTLPVYGACGISFVGMLTLLFSTTLAYYMMWGMALVIFSLAVYYTVKQL